jgi:hypothetical protein
MRPARPVLPPKAALPTVFEVLATLIITGTHELPANG